MSNKSLFKSILHTFGADATQSLSNSALTSKKFLVSFESPESKIPQRENVQEQCAADLISFLDYYRHPIEQNDFVLVPRSSLVSTENLVPNETRFSDSGCFLEPYILAQVVSGFESRGLVRGTNKPNETLKVQILSRDAGVLSEVEASRFSVKPNAALWVPQPIVDRINNSVPFISNPSDMENSQDCHSPADILVVNPSSHVAPFATARLKTTKIPAAYSASELNVLTNKQDWSKDIAVSDLRKTPVCPRSENISFREPIGKSDSPTQYTNTWCDEPVEADQMSEADDGVEVVHYRMFIRQRSMAVSQLSPASGHRPRNGLEALKATIGRKQPAGSYLGRFLERMQAESELVHEYLGALEELTPRAFPGVSVEEIKMQVLD
ncbi:unnamed protein product [Echinostoma caproni]|uniref:SH2 domain-containing protein n=1 Tax=Echinostoma caproni TaxID=27848 RepID=A0A183A520_9TREM|nr:unnamed protein product [Echinostoma caproni]